MVTLQTDNIRINFGADLLFSLTVNLSAYTSITAALNFEDAFLTYAGKKYSCYLEGSFNSPSKNEHPIEGFFNISFSTKIGNKLVEFSGQLCVKGKIPVFDKYMGAFPQSFPIVLSVTFTIR